MVTMVEARWVERYASTMKRSYPEVTHITSAYISLVKVCMAIATVNMAENSYTHMPSKRIEPDTGEQW